MKKCNECGAASERLEYCKWCEEEYCPECLDSSHDHGRSSGTPDFHESD